MTPVTCYLYRGGMTPYCQVPRPFVVLVSGVAGSGKTTLGRALAKTLRLPLVDLDSVTNPLLDALPSAELGEHWLRSSFSSEIRDGRYAALRAVTADAVASVGGAVVVAPFTAELRGGDKWQALRAALSPMEPVVIHLDADAEVFRSRRAARGAARDAYRSDVAAESAAVPVIRIDAELSTDQQLTRALVRLGARRDVDASAPLFEKTFDAILFDLDGTLIDSTASVTRSWRRFGEHFGVSAAALHENHGKPARALIAALLPSHVHAEALARITHLEVTDAVGLEPVLGAREFFESVPRDRCAIVTSGSVPIATARLNAVGFTHPDAFVTADDVTHGKPDPEPFLLAAEKLGVDPARCLVFEDAPAGFRAARAAGCSVVAVAGTVAEDELSAADLVVDGLDRIRVVVEGNVLRLVPITP